MELTLSVIEQKTDTLKHRVLLHKGTKALAAASENKDSLWEVVIPILKLVSVLFFVPKKIKKVIKQVIEVYETIQG